MSYLVDTNVFSESIKRHPDSRVTAWLEAHQTQLYLSTVTIAEIRRGIENLPNGGRKSALERWMSDLCQCMKGRVLSFNLSTAHVWGQMKARWDRQNIVLPTLDSQIAATAFRHDMTVVTRNVADFRLAGVKIINPFEITS